MYVKKGYAKVEYNGVVGYMKTKLSKKSAGSVKYISEMV